MSSSHYSLPPLRDLPAGRLERRKQHLLSEVRGSSLSRPRSRSLAVVVAAALILGALVAGPALGLQNTIRDLLGRSDVSFGDAPPAASVIKRDFDDMTTGAPKGMNPNVIAGQTRLAGTFDFGGVKRRVWVAPTATGSFCYVLERVSGGCQAVRSSGVKLDGGFVLRPGASVPVMDKLAGRVFEPSAAALQVTFEDGTKIDLPFVYVSAPIDAGFFMYKPTAAQQQPGHRPASLALLDEQGTVLADERIDWANEDRKAEELKKLMNRR
jgi:hypothetical protein